MHCDDLHSLIPLERYRTIISALNAESEAWGDRYWMRFAAQAAVLCPDPPDLLALHIRRIASALNARTAWYSSMTSPARFVVAAMLIQHHMAVSDFLGECARASDLFHEVGLRHHGFYELMAVFILRLSSQHPSPSLLEAERIKAIYEHMKGFHWWLTGPGDLRACAALASCPGTAADVAARAEKAFQLLLGCGLVKGRCLQTAANLLPVLMSDIDQAVLRYQGVKTELESRIGKLDEDCYDALVPLTLLDHAPRPVVERLCAIRDEIDLFQPDQAGPASLLIASDLTTLDLLRQRRDCLPNETPAELASMLASLHIFHRASAVLVSQLHSDAIQPITSLGDFAWPYPEVTVR